MSQIAVTKVDMKFEVAIVPVSDVDRAKTFTQSSGGGLMTISLMATIFASFS
jgi:hypothetical protein